MENDAAKLSGAEYSYVDVPDEAERLPAVCRACTACPPPCGGRLCLALLKAHSTHVSCYVLIRSSPCPDVATASTMGFTLSSQQVSPESEPMQKASWSSANPKAPDVELGAKALSMRSLLQLELQLDVERSNDFSQQEMESRPCPSSERGQFHCQTCPRSNSPCLPDSIPRNGMEW